jgi:glycosyltransferase involved in cell wall biosynthesis
MSTRLLNAESAAAAAVDDAASVRADAAPLRQAASADADAPEVSVVMPCLNEADTVGTCVGKALRAMEAHGIAGEVVVADNGSTDGSPAIAAAHGARVVHVPAKGYGSALMGGIAAARGRMLMMGDADDSYDFGECPKFVERLREGYELVQGCRLPSGGGTVAPGAMPFLHRWWGNPMFSFFARRWFGAPVHDVYCGLRGFTRAFYDRLDPHCTGMEFATEMIIKASMSGSRIAEVPITLHPDGRKVRGPHLKTFHDGWRTLRFFLLFCPRWLFLIPGGLLIFLGLCGYAIAMPGLTISGVTFDAHTLLFASLAILCGYQSVLFAVLTKAFAVSERLLPPDAWTRRLFRLVTLERGLVAGFIVALFGGALLLAAVNVWRLAEFGRLDYAQTMRLVVPGATCTAVGVQTVFSSFFLSILGLKRK